MKSFNSLVETVGVVMVSLFLRKPKLYWSLPVASSMLAALMIVGFGKPHDLPRKGIGVGLGVFLLGPLAVVLVALRMPLVKRHPKLVYVVAPLAFAGGIVLWIIAAVNLGYLVP